MKLKKIIILSVLSCLLFAGSTQAINLGGSLIDKAANTAGYAKATETTLAETIGTVIKTALSFVGVIFLALMVYAGFLWMTARGSEEPIEKAQKIIISCIIGLVITLGAYSITAFVVPALVNRGAGGTPAVGAPEEGLVGCCEICDVSIGFSDTCNNPVRVQYPNDSACQTSSECSEANSCVFSMKKVNECQ